MQILGIFMNSGGVKNSNTFMGWCKIAVDFFFCTFRHKSEKSNLNFFSQLSDEPQYKKENPES
jgi:hypothetical protein